MRLTFQDYKLLRAIKAKRLINAVYLRLERGESTVFTTDDGITDKHLLIVYKYFKKQGFPTSVVGLGLGRVDYLEIR